MFLIILTLWILTILLLINNRRGEYMWWAAATSFSGSLGAFGVLWEESIIPFVKRFFWELAYYNNLFQWIYIICSLLSTILPPLFYLLFCISYTNSLNKRTLKLVMLIAPLISLILTVAAGSVFPEPNYNYAVLNLWVIPYIAGGFYGILKRYLSETNPYISREHFQVLLLSSPMLFQLFSFYILRLFGYIEAYWMNIVFFLMYLPFVIYLVFKYGIMGLKLQMESKYFEYSFSVMKNGTDILLHTLKNQLSIISACTSNIKAEYSEYGGTIPHELDIIDSSTNHIQEMLERILKYSHDIVVTKQLNNIKELIEDVKSLIEDLLEKRNINLYVNCPADIALECDSVHIREVLLNIFRNSIDAIDRNGNITVDVEAVGNLVSIEVRDTGKGIPRSDLERVLEPFYSTKNSRENYGLGLYYCYHVMKKHKGSIVIRSKADTGTSVFLNFPT